MVPRVGLGYRGFASTSITTGIPKPKDPFKDSESVQEDSFERLEFFVKAEDGKNQRHQTTVRYENNSERFETETLPGQTCSFKSLQRALLTGTA